MRTRKQDLGTRNIVGARVEARRKELELKQKDLLQKLKSIGMDINASSLSKLEGQTRAVADHELAALSRALDVSPQWLLGMAAD